MMADMSIVNAGIEERMTYEDNIHSVARKNISIADHFFNAAPLQITISRTIDFNHP
tara:strand:- start:162 stop:329 length:168 start_codon:yes stop_codon:yes gene_type:complete